MAEDHIFTEIPRQPPSTPLLDGISLPSDLRAFDQEQLGQICDELRHYLLYSVGQSGGHFGAGLGVVELTVALHFVFNTPHDRLVWDVGHQAYPHKILTGRKHEMVRVRQQGGPCAFPSREESIYDTFGVGHSSTSISAALGMSIASQKLGDDRKSVAIIGDGALTAGMAIEALSHAGSIDNDLLVILNDNDMSISNNVGGLKDHLARILSGKTYNQVRDSGKRVLSSTPSLMELARKTEENFKGLIAPSTLFEALGFNYIGPIDGHDVEGLVATLQNMRELKGPQFLHVITQKGKGFAPAEADPIGYHAINKLEPIVPLAEIQPEPKVKQPTYSNIFGAWLVSAAAREQRLIGITPAMCEGSDLVDFSKAYPDRYYDVAIAEQHAVTLAAGLACEGMKPVVAIYSTFLQRAYDQLIHDVAIQNLDVLFAIDRAGLVGADGPTHAGSFDISFLRCIPNLVVMTPSDEQELHLMLNTGLQHEGPACVRYPRGKGPGTAVADSLGTIEIGQSRQLTQGAHVAILAFGSMVAPSIEAGKLLGATVVDMRFAKPIDEAALEQLSRSHSLFVTVEENCVAGGAGSAVSEWINEKGLSTDLMQLGLPDAFIDHGQPDALLKSCGLDALGIQTAIEQRLLSKQTPLTSVNSIS